MRRIKFLILMIGSILLGMLTAKSSQINIVTEDEIFKPVLKGVSIELSDNLPKIEEIDGGKFDLGSFSSQGNYYDTSSPEAFVRTTENKCVTEGNFWGAQCVSLAQAFWVSYAGRSIVDCGTGAARGIWECRLQNEGDDFEEINSFNELHIGDWGSFDGGEHGHIGMVIGDITNDGYIPLYGENQGGKSCAEGGSQPNIVLISSKTFLGAFRPKIYIEKLSVPDGGLVNESYTY